MINSVYLRTFVHLAEVGHFTQTAQALNMTQPGVSQHIKKLEQELGQTLLNRHGKRFELTLAGVKLLAYAKRQTQAEVDLRQQLTLDEPYQGLCRMACSGAIASLFYPRLLLLQQQHKQLRFALEAAPNAAIVELLRQDRCDIGLVTQHLDDINLQQTRLGEDELCLVLPAGADCSWETLSDLGFINHPDGHHYATAVLERNYREFKGIENLDEAGYINQLSQILLPVAQGLGFSVLPRSALTGFAQPEQLQLVALAQPVRETVYLLQKKHRPLPARYHLVIELLQAHWA